MKKHPMLLSALIANIFPALFFFEVFVLILLKIIDFTYTTYSSGGNVDSILIKLLLFLLVFSGLSGFFSVWIFRLRSNLVIKLNHGIRIGILSGLIAWFFNAYIFVWIYHDVSSESIFILFFLHMISLPLSILLGFLGGLIGGFVFRSRIAISSPAS